MNTTLLRLSAQALFGRRRGVVLLLIPAALLVLSVFVRLLTDKQVGVDAAVGARIGRRRRHRRTR